MKPQTISFLLFLLGMLLTVQQVEGVLSNVAIQSNDINGFLGNGRHGIHVMNGFPGDRAGMGPRAPPP